MNLTTIPRSAAKLPYAVARLPLGLIEDRVVVPYFDDASPVRIGYERFLGSVDQAAGRLLDDQGISRRGQDLVRKTDYLAKADQLDAKAAERRAQADEELHASKAQARQAREQAQREKDEQVSAAKEQERTDKAKAQREARARLSAERRQAERGAERRATDAEDTKQAKHDRIAAKEGSATAAPKRQLSDAAAKRAAAKDRQTEADRLEQLTAAEHRDRTSD